MLGLGGYFCTAINPNQRAATDPRLRQRGHRDRPLLPIKRN